MKYFVRVESEVARKSRRQRKDKTQAEVSEGGRESHGYRITSELLGLIESNASFSWHLQCIFC